MKQLRDEDLLTKEADPEFNELTATYLATNYKYLVADACNGEELLATYNTCAKASVCLDNAFKRAKKAYLQKVAGL